MDDHVRAYGREELISNLDSWARRGRSIKAKRFSKFPSDIDGLIAALELAKDGKERDDLVKKASRASVTHLRFQCFQLIELSRSRESYVQLLNLFEAVVESLDSRIGFLGRDDISATVVDFQLCLSRLKTYASSPKSLKVMKIEDSLRKKGWL